MADVSQSQWTWDDARKLYYYWSMTDSCYVYDNGLRIANNGVVLAYPTTVEEQDDARPRSFEPADTATNIPQQSPHQSPNYSYSQLPTQSQPTTYGQATGFPQQAEYQQPAAAAPPSVYESVQLEVIDEETKQPVQVNVERNFQQPATAADYAAVTEETLSAASRGKAYASKRFQATSGTEEKLDPRFRVRYPGYQFFTVGRVFKILWPELAGDRNRGITVATVDFGAQIALKIRWFVVIKEGQNCCSVLPIQTYGGRGVAKPATTKGHHAIIFTGNEPNPKLDELPQAGEAPMLPSIRVRGRTHSDRMDRFSRINFAKIYTVEHNVKVFDFGDVDPQSMSRFLKHFQDTWGFQLPTTTATSS